VRVPHALYGAGVVLVVLGSWLRLVRPSPPRASGAELPVAVLHPMEPVGRTAVPSYDGVVTGNIFSKQRTPSAMRFTPAGSRRVPSAGDAGRGAPITLYGITLGPRGAVALIHADPKSAGADLYHLGDLVAGGRLVAMTESTVTVARPSGSLVLHLQTGRSLKP
jgi:hypothetical protein